MIFLVLYGWFQNDIFLFNHLDTFYSNSIGFAGVWLVVIVKSLPGAKYLRTFWAWIGKRIWEMSTFYMSLEVISSLGCLKTESAIIRSVTRWEDISVQIFRCANLTLNTNINIQFFIFIAYNNLHKMLP